MPTPDELSAENARRAAPSPEVRPADTGETESVREQEAQEVGSQREEVGERKTEVEAQEVGSRTRLPVGMESEVGREKPKKDRLLVDIEAAMAEGLEELYKKLPAERQHLFRQRGEAAAVTTRLLAVAGQTHVKKIFEIVHAWLRLIPHVDRAYLEQAAKIKTDKILAVAEEERRRGNIA